MATETLDRYNAIISKFTDSSQFHMFLIEQGSKLKIKDINKLRVKDNYMRGCRSPIWVIARIEDNTWHFEFDSDTLIAKGLARIVQNVFSGMTTSEIGQITFKDFGNIARRLPVERQKGLQAMINRVHKLTKIV